MSTWYAWRLASIPEFEELWRATIWVLIFRVETGLALGERDEQAEEDLQALIGASVLG